MFEFVKRLKRMRVPHSAQTDMKTACDIYITAVKAYGQIVKMLESGQMNKATAYNQLDELEQDIRTGESILRAAGIEVPVKFIPYNKRRFLVNI